MVLQKKNFMKPDETQSPPYSKIETIKIGNVTASKITYQPGWQWSKHIKPVAGTASCQVHHFGFLISGRLHVKLDDGQEMDIEAGDVVEIPSGHDGWVVGKEPAVFLQFQS